MTDPYQGPVLTLKLQGRTNKNSVKINKIQIFDLIFYFNKTIIIFLVILWEFITIINQQEALKPWRSRLKEKRN